jgi:CelD/BcsL family acetyltransferase involved in cellulose biosynthesis
MPVITLSEIRREDDFDALRDEWDRLVDSLEVPSPFQSWTWNRVWWRHFGAGSVLRILVFREKNDVVGIAPLYQKRYGIGRLGLAGLAPIGRELHSRDRDLTEQLELLFPQPKRNILLTALSNWLQRAKWSSCLLPDLKAEDTLPPWLASRRVFTGDNVPFHYLELPDSWEDLVKGLRKSTRDNVKYYPRLMARHGHNLDFQVARTPGQATKDLRTFLELHRARAETEEGRRHGDKFWSRDCRAFIGEVVASLADQGCAKIGVLRVGGEPVAAQMWFEHGRVMFLYYSGFRPEWGKHSVAFIATQEAMKDAMSRGIRRAEFLRGGGQFKERWGGSSRFRTSVLFGRQPEMIRRLIAVRAVIRSHRQRLRIT